jgi:arabinose-5-phosphate isomerase
VVDEAQRVLGVVTAGDLTRLMEREPAFLDVPVEQVMNRSPKTVEPDALAAAAVYLMETGGRSGIMAMPVVDPEHRIVGIVHLHDLLRANAV